MAAGGRVDVLALIAVSLLCLASFVIARMLVANGVVASSLEHGQCSNPARTNRLHLHWISVSLSLPISICFRVVSLRSW